MLRVVLDTNIYVSGLLFPKGNPRLILTRAEAGDFFTFTSPPIQAETERILLEKFRLSRGEVAFACGKLWRISRIIEPTVEVEACDDPDDDKVLECALSAKADYIVSGDNDLLRLVTFRGISIVRARAFLELLTPKNGKA
jgi:putative PIN family toxin of toxin-antitoxin system